ncbi:MAG: LLM class flavin-dependent oxidoreductase [Microbacteriaceae bacterium]|jgi:alkanesulfonate monooxygenase SsuD/methylene tetrahydromethanopterin reductase-like flavin-dependent oxidoreductase (luciferase family)|nr:LLM class flavin-dependent oxidoreductase [Microbacteriaceae bacterium]HOA86710.1 LLM class flavin-dependent oxidoreductase [Microbacteriaceae bacterium]HPZ34454.1 LLM class flavin-dependent oxidoreductase [Microbacteriaceae bacterium]HQC93085.1 LLM class flavin-dependent oxidoreductase [Microbacteriaceae bacterium]
MATQRAHVSIGIAGTLGPEAAARIAVAAEAAGFSGLWVNEIAGADALGMLAAAAEASASLTLATGVIPVDRRPGAEIAEHVARLGLPADRLMIGIGSGKPGAGSLARVEAAIAEIREASTARILIGALGPRMRQLAAEQADGALMSWLTPQIAKAQAAEFHEIAPNGRVSLYVRTAVDEAGVPRRDAETVAYAGYPAYKANYARLGMDPFSTILPQPGDDSIAPGGAEYRDSGIDELVLRAMTFGDEIDDYVRFTEQAGEALGLRA